MSTPFDPNQPQQPYGQQPYHQGPPPGYQPSPAAPAERKRRWFTRALVLVPAAFVLGLIFGGVGGSSGGSTVAAAPAGTVTIPGPTTTITQAGEPGSTTTVTSEAKPAATVTMTAKAKPAATVTLTAKTKPAPTVTVTARAPKAKSAPEAPATKAASKGKSMTSEQENAVEAAQEYLDSMAFSRKGLIEQLSSDAGDGYSKKDATIAVDSLNINYYKQAVKAAKEYLDTMAFSQKGLIEQLSSSAGDGYTKAQATYGAKHAE